MRKYTKTMLVWGWGINDADYPVHTYESWYDEVGEYKRKRTWQCPYYIKWRNMIERCYSQKSLAIRLSYEGCYVCDEWKYFSSFKAWMEQQDWEGKDLDKDLIVKGNKLYSPETCFFIPSVVNTFMTERSRNRGEYPIGVTLRKINGRFKAACNDYKTNLPVYLGDFTTPEEAFRAWLLKKTELAIELAKSLDVTTANLLIARYVNYEA